MKTTEYINILIKENGDLKTLCKSNAETIRLLKREIVKLNNTISKKDKKILKLEEDSVNVKTQNELNKIKGDLKQLKEEFEYLQQEYKNVVNENVEFKRIFEDIESTCDSD